MKRDDIFQGSTSAIDLANVVAFENAGGGSEGSAQTSLRVIMRDGSDISLDTGEDASSFISAMDSHLEVQ